MARMVTFYGQLMQAWGTKEMILTQKQVDASLPSKS
jgi:hypothetical protein